jgi:hypothetical protein
MGTTFPHALADATAPTNAFRATPFADDSIFMLALAALDREVLPKAHADHATLITLSLSANDYVGHTFGPDSWEAWDELARLDARLARFFTELDHRFGAEGWAAILTADHGVTTMPEATAVAATRPWCAANAKADRWERACGPVFRLMPDDLTKELRAVAGETMGPGRWIDGIADPYVYFGKDAASAAPAARAKLVSAVSRALLAHEGVDRVIDTRTLPTSCPKEEVASIDALICRAFATGAGALYVLPKRGSFFDPSVVVGKGTSHGSPYLFDRAVPLVARAPGLISAGAVIEGPISFRVFTKTLATLLDVRAPASADDARSLAKR